jgi:hypothetical protein
MTNTQTTITVRVNNDRWFGKTVASLRKIGGRFDGASKTWTVDTSSSYNQATIRQIKSSLTLVNGCPHYTRDQGCPMHGETCAPEYN